MEFEKSNNVGVENNVEWLNQLAEETDNANFVEGVEEKGELKTICPEQEEQEPTLTPLNIEQLEDEFCRVCTAYKKPLHLSQKSIILDFSLKIIFIIVPEYWKIHAKTGNLKVWLFKFPDENRKLTKTVMVDTSVVFKPHIIPKATDGLIVLSIQHATILATNIFLKSIPISIIRFDSFPLTPLAKSVFHKSDDILSIARELNENLVDVLKAINASCITAGCRTCFPESSVDIAAVAVISSTRAMKDTKKRLFIVNKVVQEFTAVGKKLNLNKFRIYTKYAHGGLPRNLHPREKQLILSVLGYIRIGHHIEKFQTNTATLEDDVGTLLSAVNMERRRNRFNTDAFDDESLAEAKLLGIAYN